LAWPVVSIFFSCPPQCASAPQFPHGGGDIEIQVVTRSERTQNAPAAAQRATLPLASLREKQQRETTGGGVCIQKYGFEKHARLLAQLPFLIIQWFSEK
jgi:hypothetical protein